MKTILSYASAFLLSSSYLHAAIIENTITYEHDGVTLQGHHAYDDEIDGIRPGILIIHQWTGLSDYEKMRASMLAELGYNVFALDIYGEGIHPQPPEAADVSSKYKEDRGLFRERIAAGLSQLREHPLTDKSRLAAIGYCFGGTGVLELARSGAELAGVVSFHGGLGAAENMEATEESLRTKLLVLHGAIDPHVPAAEVISFQDEMEAAAADWQLISYGGAVHAFTQKSAGDDISQGAAYNQKADKRSWSHMQTFLEEIFKASE